MKEYIYSPFYSLFNSNLLYLNQYKICELPNEKLIKQKILEEEGVILYKVKKEVINGNNRILVLEPHPDDFALSAMGYIEDGQEVTVLNIFSNMNLNSFTWNEYITITEDEYEEIRLKESKIAIEEILQYDFASLKEKSMRITKKNPVEVEGIIIENVNNILKHNLNIDTLMVPMGIGNHPDHIMVYNSIMNNYINKLNRNVRIILYPEYPYARCKKHYYDRLQEIQQIHKLKAKIIDVENKLEDIVNVVSVYKSQYDDINKKQMLAVIREDCKAIAQEYNHNKLSLVYYEIDKEGS